MEHNSLILKLNAITAVVSHVPSLCMQISDVCSLIRCLLVQRYFWWELAEYTYVHICNYECVSKLKKTARYSLFLEGRYLGHTMALWKTWWSLHNKRAVIFLSEYSSVTSKAHTHAGEPNSKREASERVKQCQSVLPLLLDKHRCLKIVNSLPDLALVKWGRKIWNKTAFFRNHDTKIASFLQTLEILLFIIFIQNQSPAIKKISKANHLDIPFCNTHARISCFWPLASVLCILCIPTDLRQLGICYSERKIRVIESTSPWQ